MLIINLFEQLDLRKVKHFRYTQVDDDATEFEMLDPDCECGHCMLTMLLIGKKQSQELLDKIISNSKTKTDLEIEQEKHNEVFAEIMKGLCPFCATPLKDDATECPNPDCETNY